MQAYSNGEGKAESETLESCDTNCDAFGKVVEGDNEGCEHAGEEDVLLVDTRWLRKGDELRLGDVEFEKEEDESAGEEEEGGRVEIEVGESGGSEVDETDREHEAGGGGLPKAETMGGWIGLEDGEEGA